MYESSLFRLVTLSLMALVWQGCAEGAPQPFGPNDSGGDARARDTSVPDSAPDGTMDATPDSTTTPDATAMDATPDATAMDAGMDGTAMDATLDAVMDATPDAEADAMVMDATPDGMVVFMPPTVDGVLSTGEWDGAMVATNALASDWGPGLNELSAVYAASNGTSLWVGVEGVIEATNAIVVYVDVDGTAGGVRNMSSLDDTVGSLDNALSSTISAPSGFAADFAFGSRGMSHTGSGFDDVLGWRSITIPSTSDFGWIDNGEAPSVCGASACETRIPTSSLGVSSGGTVRLFVRIVNAMGNDTSNQTLPTDMPSAPDTVTASLSVPIP